MIEWIEFDTEQPEKMPPSLQPVLIAFLDTDPHASRYALAAWVPVETVQISDDPVVDYDPDAPVVEIEYLAPGWYEWTYTTGRAERLDDGIAVLFWAPVELPGGEA